MKTKLTLLLLWALGFPISLLAQGTAFTYQGRLMENGAAFTGSAEFQATLWDAASAGNAVAANNPATMVVGVTNGLFVLPLDFSASPFNTGEARWVQLDVRTTVGGFTPLTPRQKLTPTPYALTAGNLSGTLPASQLSGTVALGQLPAGVVTNNATGVSLTGGFNGSGAGLTNLDATTLNGAGAANFWQLGGNSVGAGEFIGSTNNQPLELWVNNQRALRLEPKAGGPNVIGGAINNVIQSGAFAGTISGGTWNILQTNVAYGTIAGGAKNQIQSLSGTYAARFGFIGGGENNNIEAYGYNGVIGGGAGNRIQYDGDSAVIGGGETNLIGTNADFGMIGGGHANRITNLAKYATIPGGSQNVVGGSYGFAAGWQARAEHQGAFVWADSQGSDFASTANNQFLIRASGGVGINKNNPAAALDVEGTVSATGFNAGGPLRLNDHEVYFHPNDIFHGLGWYGNPRYFAGINVNGPVLYGFGGGALGYTGNGTNVALLWNASGNVGIGKVNPTTALDVNGTVTATAFAGSGGGLTGISTPSLADNSVTAAKLASDVASLAKITAGTMTLANGNVGIGTTSPQSALTVANQNGRQIETGEWADLSGSAGGYGLLGGNVALDWSSSVFRYAKTHGQIGAMGFAVNYPYWNMASVISSGTASSAAGSAFTPIPIATFTYDGKVGINKINPAATLDVNGIVSASGLSLNGSARLYDNDIFLRGDNNHGVGWYGYGRPFGSATPDGPVLYGYSGGGLGTAQPGGGTNIALSWNKWGDVSIVSHLNVGGTVTAGAVNANGGVSAPTVTATSQLRLYGPRTVLAGFDGTGSHWFGPSPDDDLAFGIHRNGQNDYTLAVKGKVAANTLTTTGDVGIGTDSPTERLVVAGNLRVTGQVYAIGSIWGAFDGYLYELKKTGSGTAFWVSSDERLKQDIAPIPNAVETLEKLRGVTWHWNDAGLQHLTRDIETSWKSTSGKPEDDRELWAKKRGEATAELSKPQMGFIAQEVEQVYPDWVKTDEQGYKQVNMERLGAVLVNAIKEQQTQLYAQRQELAQKDDELQSLKARLDRLEQLFAAKNGGGQ